MIFVCIVGDPQCAADEEFPDWARETRYYRLQVEGMFARFFLRPDGQTWIVPVRPVQFPIAA